VPILNEQPKQPKSALIQIRVEEKIKLDLNQCAQFIHSTEAWVVSEALRFLFRKDREFADWKSQHNGLDNHQLPEAEVPPRSIGTR
jgi:hypothetical protein